MNEDSYKIVAWERYWLPDNGVYGPIGSRPNFHTEHSVFERSTNPIHPFVVGYIMHDDIPCDQMIGQSKIFAHEIREPWTRQEKIDHAEKLNKQTREEHGK